MSIDAIITSTSLLGDSSITSLIGTRNYQSELPTSPTYPALVYKFISDEPEPNLDASGSQLISVMVEITPWDTSISGVDSIHSAVRTVFDYTHQQTISGKLVTSIRRQPSEPIAVMDTGGNWSSPVIYKISYYE